MHLHLRPQSLHLADIYIIHPHNRMGIAHGYPDKIHGFIRQNSHLDSRTYIRSAHIHTHRNHSSILQNASEPFYTRLCLHSKFRLLRHSMVVYILAKASYAISTHLCPAAIRIVYIHIKISPGRRSYKYQSVAPNAPVPVTDKPGKDLRIIHLFSEAVHVHVVISKSFHLRESQ